MRCTGDWHVAEQNLIETKRPKPGIILYISNGPLTGTVNFSCEEILNWIRLSLIWSFIFTNGWSIVGEIYVSVYCCVVTFGSTIDIQSKSMWNDFDIYGIYYNVIRIQFNKYIYFRSYLSIVNDDDWT